MIKVTKELIKELADDIMIELSDEEIEKIVSVEKKVGKEFSYLTSINVDGVEPMHYPFDVVNSYLRDDEDAFVISKDKMMANAPEKDKDFVLIKKVVE